MVIVTGATGSVGRYVIRHLGDRGVAVRALVREKARGAALGVPYVVGDLDDRESLTRAFGGASTMFLNGPVRETMALQQIGAVDAALSCGVQRVVRISAAGATHASDRAINGWHARVDSHIEQSGASYALLRPTFFTQNLLRSADSVRRTSSLVGGFGKGRLAFIDCSDIGACAAALCSDRIEERGAFVVTGGETCSFDDVASKLSARLGRTIRYVDRPVVEIVASMVGQGMPASIAESFGKMMASFADGGASAITSVVSDLTGRSPRSVDAFLDEHIEAFR